MSPESRHESPQGFHIDEVRQTATKFAARHIEPRAAELDHGPPTFPAVVFEQGLEAGFDRFVLPEDAGGFGFHRIDLCTLVDALALTCPGHAMTFGVHAATVAALHRIGADALLERVLEAGAPIGVALPDPAPDVGELAPTLKATGAAERTLRGDAGLAFNAGPAGFLVTFAAGEEGEPLALCLQATGENASLYGPLESTLGLRALPLATTQLDGRAVRADELVAEGSTAVRFYESLLTTLCQVTAAAAAGLMGHAHRSALEYAAERYQGAKQIIDHSHLRGILGALSARSMAAQGAVFHAALVGDDPRLALGTKVTATGDALRCCTDAVQILGGYGYMRDYGLEKAMRDAAVLGLLPISNARAELQITAY